jgi:hypothetical protein
MIRTFGYIALSLILCFAATFWYLATEGITPAKMDNLVRQSIPIGSTVQEVESWLDSQGIQHVFQSDPSSDSIDYEPVTQIAQLDPGNLTGAVRGTIHHADVSLLCDGDLDIYFFFDARGRFVKHLVTSCPF